MTREAKLMCGVILITMPSIIYGGTFLLSILSGRNESLALTEFQKSMFRAGHAHAGVLVILSLLIQFFTDHSKLTNIWKWLVRTAFPFGAILVSFGFFAAAIGPNIQQPTDLIFILYAGILVLMFGMITLGIGLLKR